ncbi:hypothetical protein ANN_18885 [Periplaneta americana]|uniref:Uncharacterized protein n=1 Tax=Periplaneta americana TaxID=6978 RepID=A0ABQ8SPZ9_PERAM|nr:hypothetical protein ANN_18885 [Periplaneta americana]
MTGDRNAGGGHHGYKSRYGTGRAPKRSHRLQLQVHNLTNKTDEYRENWCLSILITNERASATDIAHLAFKSKSSWGGHVARLEDGRWTYKSTMWDPGQTGGLEADL